MEQALFSNAKRASMFRGTRVYTEIEVWNRASVRQCHNV